MPSKCDLCSVVLFSSCPQSSEHQKVFPMSQLFESRWPKWLSSFSLSPSVNNQDWSPWMMDLGLTQSKDSQVPEIDPVDQGNSVRDRVSNQERILIRDIRGFGKEITLVRVIGKGWITWFMWRTNKTLRQRGLPATTWLRILWCHGRSGTKVTPHSDLKAQAKLVNSWVLLRWNSARKNEKRHERGLIFQELVLFLYFQVTFIIQLYRDKWKIQSGRQSVTCTETTFLSAFFNIQRILSWFYIIFWQKPANILLIFTMVISRNQKTYWKA